MSYIAIDESIISGTYTSEHSGHQTCDEDDCWPTHTSGSISGNINDSASFVKINGKSIAIQGSKTIEYDNCCGSSSGFVGLCNSFIKINGISIAKEGDIINAHNGNASINIGQTGNNFVKEM